ncbi:adenylylsulfate kinase [Aminobacter sp. Y103A]|nr:adenylylsulfate kinase [Aminobacter sp. SS-2016]
MNGLQNVDLNSGVIWITGFSAAGKTAVGRQVQSQLLEAGQPSIFLDGDDLRSILGNNWGYERDQRVELAKVYFRLCSHLSSQGYAVVISAVAMYDEVVQWMRRHIPRSLQIYLRVPEDERRARDQETKKLYGSIGDVARLYDEPAAADVVIDNHGGVSPADSAALIVEAFLNTAWRSPDMGRTAHWSSYYSKGAAPSSPSPFAMAVAEKLSPRPITLLEVGCGNGRDSIFFGRQGHRVVGIDLSAQAIENCEANKGDIDAEFRSGRLPELPSLQNGKFDAVYSRFVLHAMPLAEEVETLEAVHRSLKPGGQLFIECRSINDPMARLGEVISPTERIHGHYRRFIVRDDLLRRLEVVGFDVVHSLEAKGLAVHKDDDPTVIRVEARK